MTRRWKAFVRGVDDLLLATLAAIVLLGAVVQAISEISRGLAP